MTPPQPPLFPAPGQSAGSKSPFVGLVNGRPAPLPPGIAARVDITPESVQHAAGNFATGQQHLADAWMRLQTGLDANARMAGTGAPASAFTAKYDPALETIWKGFDSGIIHLGGTSKGLTQMANNHLKADHHSRADRQGSGPVKLPFAQVYPSMSMAAPAPALGQGGSGLPGPLAKLWPNASVARLNAAAAVWRSAASEIQGIGEWLQWTIGTITDTSSGHDIDAMYGYFEKIWTPAGAGLLGTLQDACTAMASACEQYASKVQSARTTMKWELAAGGIGITLTTAGGLILTAPTAGGSDAAATAADAAEVTAILSPTASELVGSVTAMTLSLLSGDVIGALTVALTTIPTITLIETEAENELEPLIEEEIAVTEGAKPSGKLSITAANPSESEVRAAKYLQDQGRHVVLRDPVGTRAGGLTSDLLVDGEKWDVYTPKTSNVSRIVSAVASKGSQVHGGGVVIDLSETTVTPDQLANIQARVAGSGGRVGNIEVIP